MILTFSDRICILTICPDKDNIDRLTIRRELLAKVQPSSDEFIGIEYKKIPVDKGFYFSWNKEKEHEFQLEVDLLATEKNYLVSIFQEMNKNKDIHDSQLDFYMKICK